MMKSKFKATVLLLLLASFSYAQSGTQVSTPSTKVTSAQTTITKNGTDIDITKGEVVTVTEGKKGLNAVNVKRSKQSEVRANTKTAGSVGTGSTGNVEESKHAINTKGTGATRDGAGKDK